MWDVQLTGAKHKAVNLQFINFFEKHPNVEAIPNGLCNGVKQEAVKAVQTWLPGFSVSTVTQNIRYGFFSVNAINLAYI